MKNLNKIFVPALILSLFLVTPSGVNAANYGFSIYPPVVKINITPGKSITQVITIENRSTEDKTMIARIVPFDKADILGNPIVNPGTQADWLPYFSLANADIKLDEPFVSAAGSKNQIILSLSIPLDALSRDIYAALVVSTYSNTIKQDFQGTSVNASLGSNILVTVNSQAFPSTLLKITDFSISSPFSLKLGNLFILDSLTPAHFTATAVNEGNFITQANGTFRVFKGTSTPVFLQALLPQNIIAKSSRKLFNSDGETFILSPSIQYIGKYTAMMEIKNESTNATSQITLIYLPFKLLIGLALATFILTIIIKRTILFDTQIKG